MESKRATVRDSVMLFVQNAVRLRIEEFQNIKICLVENQTAVVEHVYALEAQGYFFGRHYETLHVLTDSPTWENGSPSDKMHIINTALNGIVDAFERAAKKALAFQHPYKLYFRVQPPGLGQKEGHAVEPSIVS